MKVYPCNSMTIDVYGRFPKFHRVFFGRDSGTLKSDIVSTKTSTLNLFGFETLKLKIRRLKFWKPTVTETLSPLLHEHMQQWLGKACICQSFALASVTDWGKRKV